MSKKMEIPIEEAVDFLKPRLKEIDRVGEWAWAMGYKNEKRFSLFGIVLILLCTGCLSQNNDVVHDNTEEIPEHLLHVENLVVHPKNVEPTYSIHFERDMIFKAGFQSREDEDTDVYIGSMRQFAIDDTNRVYVYSGRTMYVFNSDGTYLTSMGGDGEGPGEFRSFLPVQPKIQRKQLYAYDEILHIINVYCLVTLSPVHQILVNPENWNEIEELEQTASRISNYHVRTDNTLLFAFREPFPSADRVWLDVPSANPTPEVKKYLRYYLMNMEGQIISGKIFEQLDVNFYPGSLSGMRRGITPHLPSARSSLIAVSEDGYIFSAWTEDFVIEVYSPDGEYLRSFYHPFEKADLNQEDILNHSFSRVPGQPVRDLRCVNYPDTWPALNIMLVDDEKRLWVSTITDDEEHYEWWMLDEYGELLAKFQWSGQRLYRHSEENEIVTVKNGYLYTHETDEESGIGQIVRYRVKMKEI